MEKVEIASTHKKIARDQSRNDGYLQFLHIISVCPSKYVRTVRPICLVRKRNTIIILIQTVHFSSTKCQLEVQDERYCLSGNWRFC